MSDEHPEGAIPLPVEWHVPDDLVARYATNMIVQRAENEFIISFFETKPPLLLGTPEEVAEQARQLTAVRATCVAQIIVAANKMPAFVDALQRNLSRVPDPEDLNEE